MTPRFLFSFCPILSLLVAGCSTPKNEAPTTNAVPLRIVSASKELTEMVFALGEGHRIVGDDFSSNFPAAADSVPKVGYHRLLSTEGIISLKPDVVIHDGDVAPPKVMESIAQVGIPIKIFPAGRTIDSTELTIRNLAAFLHVPKKGDSLCRVLDSDMSAVEQLHFTDTPRVMIIHFGRVANNYLVMGGHKTGAVHITLSSVMDILFHPNRAPQSEDVLLQNVFYQIRLPRVILTALVGASLALSGTLMQALFRNPIVEPGLVGTSSGAAFGAAIVFVLGKNMSWMTGTWFEPILLPLFAFGGALIATIVVYRISASAGKVTIATMLLAGIAINGLATSGSST